MTEPAKIADCSFLHFVYPFTFRAEEFEERIATLDGQKDVWLPKAFPAGETLSHVADYLQPREGHPRAARLWKLSEQNNMPLRLTRDLDCRLMTNKKEIPFIFGGAQKNSAAVELALFGVGVGFLTVAVQPKGADIPTWLAFLHYFRVMDGNHDVSLTITAADARRPSEFAHGAVTYTEIRDTLLGTAALPGESAKHWWYDVFVPDRMIPFAVLFVDGLNDERERGELLYRVRNFFRTEQTVIATDEDLQVKRHPALLPYAEGQQFLFSLEGGAFVAFDAPKDNLFFRETLPSHLRDQYFLVFLLALHQRFALIRLSQRVAERWTGDRDDRFVRFGRIREDFLDFSARGYFVQVMQREHHHRFYRKWHEIFQMDALYQEVRNEIREMHDYLLMKQNERLQELQEGQRHQLEQEAEKSERDREARDRREREVSLLIGSATLAVAVPALTFGFLSINIEAYKLTIALAAWIAGGAFSISALTTIVIWWRRPTRKR